MEGQLVDIEVEPLVDFPREISVHHIVEDQVNKGVAARGQCAVAILPRTLPLIQKMR
jgi:hypothetical protein